MGDELTVALMDVRGFKLENFARFHPGGSLGRRLLSKVRDEMFSDNFPYVSSDADFTSIINKISSTHLGLTIVKLNNDSLAIITDGDLRRAIESKGRDAFDLVAKDIASINPASISPEFNIQVDYEVMESKGITSLIVQESNTVVGILKK